MLFISLNIFLIVKFTDVVKSLLLDSSSLLFSRYTWLEKTEPYRNCLIWGSKWSGKIVLGWNVLHSKCLASRCLGIEVSRKIRKHLFRWTCWIWLNRCWRGMRLLSKQSRFVLSQLDSKLYLLFPTVNSMSKQDLASVSEIIVCLFVCLLIVYFWGRESILLISTY